jgi:hypothetical protein
MHKIKLASGDYDAYYQRVNLDFNAFSPDTEQKY